MIGGENVEKRKINVPLSYEVSNSFDSERFLKVRIKIMHAGLNLNNSYFSSEVIDKAKPTLANIPILAFVKKEDGTSNEDFAGHEFEIKITEDDIKYVYLGRPIGIIPETNNYTVESDEDGKQFVIVDGYVWKQYANSALDIINRDQVKKVSMEVIVNEYDWQDNYVDILDYSYTGVTMLGENVREAMLGAKADIITYSQTTISDMMFELKTALKGGQEEMKVKNTIEEAIVTDAPVEEQATVDAFAEEEIVENAEVEKEPEVEVEFEAAEAAEEEVKAEEPINYEQQIIELNQQIADLQAKNAELQAFADETNTKQKEVAVEELFSRFSDLLENTDAQALKATAMDADLTALETNLFALRGKQMDFSAKAPEKKDWTAMMINYSNDQAETEPEWAGLVRSIQKD